jgi:hypothetical protein
MPQGSMMVALGPVAGAKFARVEGRFLGNNRRQGDVAPADRCVNTRQLLASLASGIEASSSMPVTKLDDAD